MIRSRSLLLGFVGLSLWGCTRWGYEALPDVDGQAGDSSSLGSGASDNGDGGTGTGSRASSGGSATGGTSTGGTSTGGGSTGGGSTGGVASGGMSSGGTASGGMPSSGGVSSGGAATGGDSSGGSATGGSATGGSATGGAATGGASTGGAASGGGGTGGSGGSTNAPSAVIAATPGLGTPLTVFNVDASGSSDVEDTASALTYSWDWTSDGTYDDSGMTAQHTYGSPGDYTITLRATDTDGNSSVTTRSVSVVAAGSLLLVTTAVDEANAGATPASPGGTGFSLREAITYSVITAGKQSIGFASKMVITPNNALPSFDDATDLFGDGTVIDGNKLNGSGNCLIARHTVRFYDLEVRNCPGSPISVQMADGAVVSRCYLHDNGKALTSFSSSNIVFGPGNVIANSGAEGILLQSDWDLVIGNEIYDSATLGVYVAGGAWYGQVIDNLIVGGQTSVLVDAGEVTVWQNTLVGASVNAIRVVGGLTGAKVQNNILFGAVGAALDATNASFAAQDHNLFFGNGGAACSACTLGPGTLTSDPLFVSSATRDYRLQDTSPAIDAGTALGVDVNGAAPGSFNGLAPDIGSFEAP